MAQATKGRTRTTRSKASSGAEIGWKRPTPPPTPVLTATDGFPEAQASTATGAKRRWVGRTGRRHPPPDVKPEASSVAVEPPIEGGVTNPDEKPKRRRGSRGGRRHKRPAEESGPESTGGQESAATLPQKAASRKRSAESKQSEPTASRRSTARSRDHGSAAERLTSPRQPVARAKARIPVTGAPTDEVPPPFAHNAEYEFARILDFYGIDWQYEPRSFPLRYDRGHVTEAFTPDFYLPDLSMYVELTTLKANLTAEKNRKMRLLKELYPGVNIIMLKKKDYLRLLAKYGYGPLSPGQVPDIDRVLITATKLQQRIGQLGAQISRDYAGKEPILVGVLRGVLCFMADLMRHISVPSTIDLMSISSYEGNGSAAVRILKDLDENIKGRDVLLVEDIVDTGMTLNHIIDYLNTKRPASIKVCTLLDKRARRIVNVPLDYVAFEVPDEFVVGYGLDFQQHFRNLPFIAILKHELLP